MSAKTNVSVPTTNDPGVKDEEKDDGSGPCGWGPFSPAVCQRFRDPRWLLFCLCWVSFIQGMVVAGFTSAVLSSIERRYELSSSESGFISSCYDIASVLCLVPVAYFGGLGRKARYIGIGFLALGTGAILFSLPHFTTGNYLLSDDGDDHELCVASRGAYDCSESGDLSFYKYVFYVAMLIQGAGGSPLFTLGPTYLDDNISVRSSSLYLAIYHACNILGPGIGFLAGSAFLEIYVDFNKVDFLTVDISHNSSRFVGAWWIGYVIGGILAMLVAVPLCGFPSHLPGTAELRKLKDKEVHTRSGVVDNSSSGNNKKFNLKSLKSSLKTILTNPTYMFLNIVAVTEGTLLGGYVAFLPKFIEIQFKLPSSTAGLYVGALAIGAGAGGTVLGGYIVKRFDMHVRSILKMSICLIIIGLLAVLVLIANCNNLPFAGVNTDYAATNHSLKFMGSFHNDSCHKSCGCRQENSYNPVCGKDGITYYSPCFAGCLNIDQDQEPWAYYNCSCVGLGDDVFDARLGPCESPCSLLPAYLVCIAIIMFTTFMMTMPSLTASLRCMPHKERSFALGIQWMFAKCLGFIPGPILFGKLIDMSCLLWQTKCGTTGSCFFYDNEKLSFYMMAVSLTCKTLSAVFFVCALSCYKTRADDKDVDMETDDNNSYGISTANSKMSISTVEDVVSGASFTDISGDNFIEIGSTIHNSEKTVIYNNNYPSECNMHSPSSITGGTRNASSQSSVILGNGSSKKLSESNLEGTLKREQYSASNNKIWNISNGYDNKGYENDLSVVPNKDSENFVRNNLSHQDGMHLKNRLVFSESCETTKL